MSKSKSEGQIVCPTCDRSFGTKNGMKSHFYQAHGRRYDEYRIERKYGVPAGWLAEALYWYIGYSLNNTADILAVSYDVVEVLLEDNGCGHRNCSEATRYRWQSMSSDERSQLLGPAHDKTRRLTEKGENPLVNWTMDNKDVLAESAPVENLWHNNPKYDRPPASELTGQESPNWRGGKSIYDAVKQLLPGHRWQQISHETIEAVGKCEWCGTNSSECYRLDAHHIVPILCGGTNQPWNLMCLCRSCHSTAERYTRKLLDPVLVE